MEISLRKSFLHCDIRFINSAMECWNFLVARLNLYFKTATVCFNLGFFFLQLYFQNSIIALLVADPNRHIEVSLSRVATSKLPEAEEPSKYHPVDNSLLVSKPLTTTLKPSKFDENSKPVKKRYVTKPKTPKPEAAKIDKKKSDIELKVNVNHVCNHNHTEEGQVYLVTELQDKSPSKNRRSSNASDFLFLDVDDFCSILSSNNLGTSNEMMVFSYAIRWFEFKLKERWVHADIVLRCVRFGLIKPRDLIKCHAKCQELGFLENSSVCGHLYCGLLWSCAKRYDLEHLIPHMKPERREIKTNMELERPHLVICSSSAITINSY
ncbi:hypothetical protein CHUAL_013730 [Chamberlinius hualienensis]